MIRRLLAAALLLSPLPALAQTAPVLKTSVTVNADVVRIGDLVDNAGAAADLAVFRAPNAGETGAVSTDAVLAALRAKNVIGVDTRGLREVAVTRASHAISQQDFEQRALAALAAQYALGDLSVLRISFDAELPSAVLDAPGARLRIARARYEARGGRFELTLTNDVARVPLTITGTLTEMVEVVTLRRALDRGSVIGASDVTVERRPRSEIGGDDAAVTPSEVVGTSPRRPMRAGQLLRKSDVSRPEIIAKNDLVTIVYEAPGLMLTLRGRAMDSGALGDAIAVTNLQSKRVLQATATGPGEVHVSAGGTRLADAPSSSVSVR